MILRRLQIERFRNLIGVDLAFPEAGTILIEGGNEAGKSSLIEAIFFALYGRDGGEESAVSLDFSVQGAEFQVRRVVAAEPSIEFACHAERARLEGADAERRLAETLGIGLDTLRTARFLGQDDSSRLESLPAQARAETVNELLGLSALTALARSTTITSDDQAALERQRSRVAIARLDAEGIALRQCETSARRAAEISRLIAAEAEALRLENELVCPARTEIDELAVRRREAARREETRKALAERRSLLHEDLPLHLTSWRTALVALIEAQAQVKALSELDAGLAAREHVVTEGQALALRLALLERSEAAQMSAETVLAEARAAWAEREGLDAEFTAGAEASDRLAAEQSDAETALAEAETALRERTTDRERLHLLDQLQLHQDTIGRTRRDAEELAVRLRDAWERSHQLEKLNERLAAIEALRAARAGREQIEGQHAAICQLLEETRERLQRSTERETLIAEYEAKLNALVVEATHCEANLTAIDASLRQADLRDTLFAWADTVEHHTSATSAQRRMADAQARLSVLAAERLSLQKQRDQAGRNPLATLNGTVRRLDLDIFRVDERVRHLADEVRVLQDMSPDIAMVEGLEARLGANVATIERLGGTIPANPIEARDLAVRLPEAGPERTRRQKMQEAVAHAQAEVQATQRLLEQARAETDDPTQLPLRIAELEAEATRLKNALDQAESSDPAAIDAEWDALQEERAAALAARQSLAEMEEEEKELFELSQREEQDAAALAGELEITLEAVGEERTRLRERLEAESVETLEERVAGLRATLRDVERRLVQHQTEQEQRGRQRNAASPEELRAFLARAEAEVEEHTRRIAEEADLRGSLETLGLPTATVSLTPHLAVLESDLLRDRERVREFADWRQRLTECEKASKDARTTVTRAWRLAAAGAALPETPEAAMDLLPALRTEVDAALTELGPDDEAPAESAARTESLRDTVAQGRAEQKRLRKEASALRSRLEIAGDESLDVLAESVPDLHTRDVAGWYAEVDRSREALVENRAARAALARPQEVAEEPALVLEEEEAALAEAEGQMQIRIRAGQIVARAREAAAGRIWPLTLQNARALLATLTDGRYTDLRWEEDSDRIEVFDTRHERFVDRCRCSGGVREQVSLALRLAFALATQTGGRTGWLALDDPLARFDPARVQAFVEMLTAGPIHEKFAQVFLIARSDAVPPVRFDGRIRLANGTVVDASL